MIPLITDWGYGGGGYNDGWGYGGGGYGGGYHDFGYGPPRGGPRGGVSLPLYFLLLSVSVSVTSLLFISLVSSFV